MLWFASIATAFAVLAAGCGRAGFDSLVDAAPTVLEPDLMLLLPDHVPSLIGYWRMDGNGIDSGPRGNDLAPLQGTPEFIADGVIGSATELFDTSFVLSARADLEAPFVSYSAWFRSDLTLTASSNSGQTLFRISCPTCGGDQEIDISMRVEVRNDGQMKTVTGDLAAGSIDANTWHQVVGVYAAEGARLYLDGDLVTSAAATEPMLQSAMGILWVGQLWPNRAPLFNPQFLHGGLDELALWSSALTDAEARSIYVNQRP